MFIFSHYSEDIPYSPPRIARDELVPWQDSFSVGNPLIDSEHQEIVRLLNLLYEDWRLGASRFDILSLHDELVANFDLHFANEEEMLVRYRCPRLGEHVAEHLKLAVELHAIGQSLFSCDQDEGEAHLVAFLRKMLIEHVRTFDSDLKDCVPQ